MGSRGLYQVGAGATGGERVKDDFEVEGMPAGWRVLFSTEGRQEEPCVMVLGSPQPVG